MKKTALLFLIAFTAFTASAQEAIEGLWNTGTQNTIVEIKPQKDELKGFIQSSDNSDVEIGKLLIKDIEKKGKVYEGQLYAIKRSRWVNATFKPNGDRMTVTVSVGPRSKTIEWVKAEQPK